MSYKASTMILENTFDRLLDLMIPYEETLTVIVVKQNILSYIYVGRASMHLHKFVLCKLR